AHLTLQKQFADRSVQKTYLTVVAGVPYPASAIIDAPIGRHSQERTKMSVYQATATRHAKTTYRTIGKTDDVALLACDLHTGRTHQIRVHLKSIGHPVLGDPSYGSGQSEDIAQKNDIDFLCLHAWKLSFTSPSKKKVDVMSTLPKNFSALLKRLEIKEPT
ncbi:MAG: RluA family pseudouridine synthase, partial [Candidatus Peribacteraceae bacterium]|nr:RluA family pseudouridine synthase [Candidatus Peribacteraceae bacterium]